MLVHCIELSGGVIAQKGSNTATIRIVASLADVPKDPVSQDALGFAASAERLAEHFALGLTVFTRSVRYYQLVAAGIRIAAEAGVADPRDVVLRLERTWALASYLADKAAGDRSGSGLLGITYVRSAAEAAKARQELDYPLFQRGSQGRAGALGLYRRSAHNLLLLDAGSVTSLGQRLSDTFVADVESSGLRPAALVRVKSTSSTALRDFGRKAGLFAAIDRHTAEAAWDALSNDVNRRAAAKTLRNGRQSQDALLARLGGTPRFRVQASAAVALEQTYAALSRPLDAAVEVASQAGSVEPSEIRRSPALLDVLDDWKARAQQAVEDLERGGVDHELVDLGRRVAEAHHPWEAVEILVDRHRRVQEAKGRPPWLDWRGGHLVRAAATPNPGYRPFDLASAPRGHDFRLLNLRGLAREIAAAGVAL